MSDRGLWDRSPPTNTSTGTTSRGQSSGQLSAPTPRRLPVPPPPPPAATRPVGYSANRAPPQSTPSNGFNNSAPPPPPQGSRNVPGHLGGPIRPSPPHQSYSHQYLQSQSLPQGSTRTPPPLVDEQDYDHDGSTGSKKREEASSLPAGEPSGSSSSSSMNNNRSMGRLSATSATPMTSPRGILRTPQSSAIGSSAIGSNMSVSRHSTSHHSSSHHSTSHRSVQTAPPAHRHSSSLLSPHTPQHTQHTPTLMPDYTAPLRDAATISHGATTHTHTPGNGSSSGSGLRSRTRSRSPGALVDGSGGGSGSRESVAIGIDESTGSGRMRHWKKMSSLCDEGDAIRVEDNSDAGKALNQSGATRTKLAGATKISGSSGSGSGIGRRSNGDRLPLYHPNQQRRSQAYTNTPYHAHGHAPAQAVSMAPSWITHSAFLLVILYVMLDSKAKVDRSTAQLRYYREEESRVNAKIAEFEERARQLSVETERLRRDNEALEELKAEQLAKLARLDDEEGMVAAIEKERTKMLHRDSIIRNQMQILQERIQIESRREAAEKFGDGHILVEVDLIFPKSAPTHDEETGRRLPTKFHIEMASLDVMPHTVQLFLEQVHHGLWDGCAFVWNPDHLVLASPHVHAEEVVDEDTGETRLEVFEDDEKREDFVESGYTSVSFQEYSPDFPHRQYTLGYAGRPGGPNFYINMKDNTRVHGPQLDLKEDDEIDADPAFGKVVAGFDTVNRMHNMPTKVGGTGWHKDSFENDIIIRYAKILPQKPEQIE